MWIDNYIYICIHAYKYWYLYNTKYVYNTIYIYTYCTYVCCYLCDKSPSIHSLISPILRDGACRAGTLDLLDLVEPLDPLDLGGGITWGPVGDPLGTPKSSETGGWMGKAMLWASQILEKTYFLREWDGNSECPLPSWIAWGFGGLWPMKMRSVIYQDEGKTTEEVKMALKRKC